MNSKHQIYRKIVIVFVASLITNALLLFSALILFMVQNQQGESGIKTDTKATALPLEEKPEFIANLDPNRGICLQCDVKDVPISQTLYDRFIETDDNVKLCCIEKQPDIQKLIMEMALSSIENREEFVEGIDVDTMKWWRNLKYAAHVYADPGKVRDNRGLVWKQNGHVTSIINHLELLEDGNMTLTELGAEGTYLIYSHVMFHFTTPDYPPIGYHRITRVNALNTKSTPLMMKFGGSSSTKDFHRSFACCTVELGLNEKISSDISIQDQHGRTSTYTKTKYIHDGKYSNFFGMIKLK